MERTQLLVGLQYQLLPFCPPHPHYVSLFFFKDFIYIFEKERVGEGQREKQTPP